jgi:hypothetical protein
MRRLVSSILMLAATTAAQQFSEAEPNDTVGQATPLVFGQQCNAQFNVSGDVDWYTFTTTGGYHLISTTGAIDNVMNIFDATGTTLLAWTDDGQGTLASYWGNIPAGTYTLRLTPFGGTATGPYAIDISAPTSKPYTGSEVEPNDTLATALSVGDGAQINSSLGAPVTVVVGGAAAGTVVATNTVASSTTTVITLGTPIAVGAYNGVGYFVRFTSGVNAGLSRRITANIATTITTEAWATAPVATDAFEIVTNSATVLADTVAASSTTVITATAPLIATAFTTPTTSHAVRMLTGPNAGLSRTITSNTATTITTSAWPVANTVGDSYIVVAGGGTSSIVPTFPLIAGQYSDARHWVRCTSGANAGQQRSILNNTAAYLQLTASFTNAVAPGDTFEIDQYDSDLYRVDVTAPRALVVFSVTDGDLPWVSGWSYEVLDALGVRVDAATLATNLADSGSFNPRVSSFRVWPTGTYYVRIFQRRTIPTTATAIVNTGNYRFELKVRDMNVGVVAEIEPNNSAATATPIVPGQQAQGNVTNGVDGSDWYGPITFTSQSLLCFQTANGSTPALGDSTINLYQVLDPIGPVLSAATAVVSGNILEGAAGPSHARGVFNFLLPGTTYYLEVVSPGVAANQSGNYNLELSLVDNPTYSAGNFAQVAANAAGCGTAGVPTITRVLATELPIVGQTMATRTTNLNGIANLGLLVIGLSPAAGTVFNPLPVDLTLAGAPGCTLNASPLLIEFMPGDVTGTANYTIACPPVLSLAGTTLFLQPVKWDLSLNALGVQPGNWLRLIYGTRAF